MTVEYLKTKISILRRVEYFSNGWAAQYKNKTFFYNLCNHNDDFSVQASWLFFATSSRKFPYGGIGSTVNQSKATESLRCSLDNQIFSMEAMLRI